MRRRRGARRPVSRASAAAPGAPARRACRDRGPARSPGPPGGRASGRVRDWAPGRGDRARAADRGGDRAVGSACLALLAKSCGMIARCAALHREAWDSGLLQVGVAGPMVLRRGASGGARGVGGVAPTYGGASPRRAMFQGAMMIAHLPCRTDRLLLRTLRLSDIDAFHGYRSREDEARLQGWSPMPREQALAFLREEAADAPLRAGAWRQIGIATHGDVLVGDIGVHLSGDLGVAGF